MTFELVMRSILLGVGLAMDAFSVSLADGLSEPGMKKRRMLLIAGTFAAFQFAMPVIGWVLVKTAVERLTFLEKFIPWIALLLLLYIGGKMLAEGIREMRSASTDTPDAKPASDAGNLTLYALIIQGIATSIDALSVGFTIETYGFYLAVASSLIIGVVTLMICLTGLMLGRKLGTSLAGCASVLGGVILIAIGIEIWAKGIFM